MSNPLYSEAFFVDKCACLQVEARANGTRAVTYSPTDGGGEIVDTFDTVMFAVGRQPVTASLQLKKAGVAVNKAGKIPVFHERTTTPHIYAVGDVIEGGLELTPVAIQAGLLLAKRLYSGSKVHMDYNVSSGNRDLDRMQQTNQNRTGASGQSCPLVLLGEILLVIVFVLCTALSTPQMVATTVFTPLEYGAIGLSEEQAIGAFGEDQIEVLHSQFTPLEHTLPDRQELCYCKV